MYKTILFWMPLFLSLFLSKPCLTQNTKANFGTSIHYSGITTISLATNFSLSFNNHHYLSTGPNFPLYNSSNNSDLEIAWDLQYYYLLGKATDNLRFLIGGNVMLERFKSFNFPGGKKQIDFSKFQKSPSFTYLGGQIFSGIAFQLDNDLHLRLGAGYGDSRTLAPYLKQPNSGRAESNRSGLILKLGLNFHFIKPKPEK